MKKLINIQKATIGNSEVNAVSARELYLGLGFDKSHWAKWATLNVEQNEFFTQGVDFIQLATSASANTPNPPKDYAISIEFAKHISLMAKTKKGHEYRGYFLELEKQPSRTTHLPPMGEAAQAAIIFADYLRLPESGKLLLLNTVNESYGSPMQLPTYGVDAPPSEMHGNSSKPTNSATALLIEHGVGMSAIVFNKLLIEHGLLETLTRKSTGNKTKSYKSVTKLGLEYGKNDTDKASPNETQPHWYIHQFSELLDLVLSDSLAA